MAIKRREFLGHVAAGSAILTVPAFISGCGVNQALAVKEATPKNPFLEWFGIDEAMIARVMAELTAQGADTADLYFQHQRSNTIGMEGGIVSRAHTEISQGVGLRVVLEEHTGYAFTEDLTLPSMLAAARTAAVVAGHGIAAPPQAFNPKKTGDLYAIKVPWSEIGLDRKVLLLESINEKVHKAEPTVSGVSLHWSDVDERVLIATLGGDLIADHRPMTRLSTQVSVTRSGVTQTGFSNISAREEFSWYTDERIDKMVGEALARTMVLFDARRAPEGEMPVILASGSSGILLHETIGHGMEADFNRKGASIYADKMGKKIAEPIVTIVDQGTLPHARGALNYDDEGNASGRTVMVENGVLRAYLHDSGSARHYKVDVTGSARRQSYKFAPMPRMTCTFMEDGPHTKEEIVAALGHGIIAETYTDGQVQLGEGDFNFQVKHGWLIEKGKVTVPIKDFNIVGNGPELLQRITMVANDARLDTGGWTCGKNGQSVPVSQGMPSVLVSTMRVSGGTSMP